MAMKMNGVERLAFARWFHDRGLDCARLGQYPNADCCLRVAALVFADLDELSLEEACRRQRRQISQEWIQAREAAPKARQRPPPQEAASETAIADGVPATQPARAIHDQGSIPMGGSKDEPRITTLPAISAGDADHQWAGTVPVPNPDARVTRQELLLLGLHLAATENILEAIGVLAVWLDEMGPLNHGFAVSADECLAWQTLARLRKQMGYTAFESLLHRIEVGGHDPYWLWRDEDNNLEREPDEQAVLDRVVPQTVDYSRQFRGMNGDWEYTLVQLAQIASVQGNEPLAQCLIAVQAYLSGSPSDVCVAKIPAKFRSVWRAFTEGWC